MPYRLATPQKMVGIARFELAAPCSQGRCATGLRYIPFQMTLLVYHIRLSLSNKFLNYLIKNQIANLEDIKKIKLDGYSLNKDLSDEKNLIFTRKNS